MDYNLSRLKRPGNDLWLTLICAMLVMLFIYTAVSKVLEFEEYKNQINNQVLPSFLKWLVIWTLPSVEIIVSVLLIFKETRVIGLWLSALLMFLFTAYIAIILSDWVNRVPCSCGGVIKALGWKSHLFFNIFFTLLSLLGIYISDRERRTVGAD